MEPILGYAALTAVFSAGAAWAGVKTSLNGTKRRVEETHDRLAKHIEDESQNDLITHERIARIETKLDVALEKFLK